MIRRLYNSFSFRIIQYYLAMFIFHYSRIKYLVEQLDLHQNEVIHTIDSEGQTQFKQHRLIKRSNICSFLHLAIASTLLLPLISQNVIAEGLSVTPGKY